MTKAKGRTVHAQLVKQLPCSLTYWPAYWNFTTSTKWSIHTAESGRQMFLTCNVESHLPWPSTLQYLFYSIFFSDNTHSRANRAKFSRLHVKLLYQPVFIFPWLCLYIHVYFGNILPGEHLHMHQLYKVQAHTHTHTHTHTQTHTLVGFQFAAGGWTTGS